MKRVVITGMGCISGMGENLAKTWESACNGMGSISRVSIAVSNEPELVVEGLAALVPETKFEALSEQFGFRAVNSVDRVANLAAVATLEALSDASLSPRCPELETASVLYGSASGGNNSMEAGYQRLFGARLSTLHPLTVPRYMVSGAASHLSMLFGIQGPAFAISSACSSSAHAIGEGMERIRAGRDRMAIVGGSDASVTYGSIIAWRALQAVSDDACRPFSAGRTGTALGEGAATLVLEELESAQRRGARIYGELIGYGATSDAGHITKPNTASAVRTIKLAYESAKLPMSEPALISAHGTGTLVNDSSEAAALHAAYDATLSSCRVIATKSSHGHMLGACGAIELILAVLALQHRVAPAVLGFLERDPKCDLPLVLSTEPIDYRTTLSTSFAFGGLNCALLARRLEA